MVLKTILNCREIDESNVSKACIVMGFETMWNFYVKSIQVYTVFIVVLFCF